MVFLPAHTSSIFERTLLIKAALVITFSEAERLATVDRGWGLLTSGEIREERIKGQLLTTTVKFLHLRPSEHDHHRYLLCES